MLIAVLLTCFSVSGITGAAYADVRKADVILGSSVESRDLSVSQCPSIDADYAVVMSEDGTVYFERNATKATQIASITKIMTAIVALENSELSSPVTVSQRAASVGESSASLQVGDTLTLEAALKALLLSSGNDAATAIAETVGARLSGNTKSGADAENVFIDAMNAKAEKLALVDTVFRNPHGLDDGQYVGDQHSCALDVAVMAKHAMGNATFRSIVSTASDTISVKRSSGSTGDISLATTDQMLGKYAGACGIKTGFTDLAGASFAAAVNRDGKDVYAIVIHSSSDTQRFSDAEALFDWYYDHTIEYPLANSTTTAAMQSDGQTRAVPIVARVAHADWIDKTVAATLADPDQSLEIFDLNGNISQVAQYNTVTGDVRVGDKVGSITFKQRNNELITVDLVAVEEVKAPNLFEGIGIWWDRFFRGFSGQATTATHELLNQTPLVNDKATGSTLR